MDGPKGIITLNENKAFSPLKDKKSTALVAEAHEDEEQVTEDATGNRTTSGDPRSATRPDNTENTSAQPSGTPQ